MIQNIHDVQVKEQRSSSAALGVLVGLSIHALVPGLSSGFWLWLTKLGDVCRAGTSSFLSSYLPLPSDAHALVRHGVRETIQETTGSTVHGLTYNTQFTK